MTYKTGNDPDKNRQMQQIEKWVVYVKGSRCLEIL